MKNNDIRNYSISDRMTLIYEYADRKEKIGMRKIITSFLDAGFTLKQISDITGQTIQEIEKS